MVVVVEVIMSTSCPFVTEAYMCCRHFWRFAEQRFFTAGYVTQAGFGCSSRVSHAQMYVHS